MDRNAAGPAEERPQHRQNVADRVIRVILGRAGAMSALPSEWAVADEAAGFLTFTRANAPNVTVLISSA
jgi:hypothetical protein